MRRRDFLTRTGAMGLRFTASAGAALARARTAAARQDRTLVLGAGLAGLAAARELQARGHEVVVLKARERIGGRVWSSTAWPGLPVDLGATWIHGVEGNPLTEMADRIGASRVVTRYGRSVTYGASGRPLSQADEDRIEALRKQVFSTLRRARDLRADVSIRQALKPLAAPLGDISSKARQFLEFIVNSEIEHEYSGSAAELSVFWYDSDRAFPGDDVLFPQGFGALAEYLAQGLRIELGQVVEQVQWRPAPVRVVTATHEFVADQVVVTLPLGVLQTGRVRFVPELPRGKQRAIARLGMGVLNKCCLRFPETFWPKDVDWLQHVSERPGEWTEWVSLRRAAKQDVLLGFNAADRGREIEAWSDERIVDSAMQVLRTIYGKNIPDPLDYQLTRWASDPFARGAYSYHRLGSSPETRGDLAACVERLLFFAGEATSRHYFGTAHGAYLSGLRAAREILTA